MAGIVEELKRRNVFRVAGAYLVVSWLLVQVVDVLWEFFPPGSQQLIVTGLAIGFPVVVLFSWAYEITSKGIRRETDISSGERRKGHVLDLITVVAALGIVASLFLIRPSTSCAAAPLASVAVLPFENLSADDQGKFLSAGLAEALIDKLSENPNLRVTAPESARAADNSQDTENIACELGAAHLVTGSVQRDGENIRINTRLLNAVDRQNLWAEKYDRVYSNAFAIQDEIAAIVSAQIENELDDAIPYVLDNIGTDDIEAYEHYLQGLSARRDRNYDSLQTAENQFKMALARDPGFRDAKSALAFVLISQWLVGMREFDEIFPDATALAGQVLERYPNDIDARTVLATIEGRRVLNEGRSASVQIDQLLGLIEDAPNAARPKRALAYLMRWSERPEEALSYFSQVAELDPMNVVVLHNMAQESSELGDWESARSYANRAIEINPDYAGAYEQLAIIGQFTGNTKEYVGNLIKAANADPLDQGYNRELAQMLYSMNFDDVADLYWQRLIAVTPSGPQKRVLEMWRANARQDLPEAERTARAVIAEEVRREQSDVWGLAVLSLMRAANKLGTGADALEYLQQHDPLILDTDSDSVSVRTVIGQQHVGWLLVDHLTRQELVAFFEAVDRRVAERGIGYNPYYVLSKHAALGEIDAGVALAQQFLEWPLLISLNIRWVWRHPVYADIVADPRIEPSFQEFLKDFDRVQAEVQELLESEAI